jgi:hypothetical protein
MIYSCCYVALLKMERKIGYYWINDGDGNDTIAEYIGNDEWLFTGCSLKFSTDPKWVIGNRIEL